MFLKKGLPPKIMQRDEMTQKILDKISEITGKSIEDFVKVVKLKKLAKHGEIRNLFKDEYGLTYEGIALIDLRLKSDYSTDLPQEIRG